MEISPGELARWRAERSDFAIFDVREAWELEQSSLPGAIHIPMQQLAADTSVLPRDRDVVLICRSGGRTDMLADHLDEALLGSARLDEPVSRTA